MTEKPKSSLIRMTRYRRATGEIIGWLEHRGNATCANATNGEIEGAFNGVTTYIFEGPDGPVATPRPRTPIRQDKGAIAANDADMVTFSGIPPGTTLVLDDDRAFPLPDGELVFTASVAGTYRLLFRHFPYLDTALTVEAT